MGESIASKFGLKLGKWTDDTQIGLFLADPLLMNKWELNEHDLMHRFLS